MSAWDADKIDGDIRYGLTVGGEKYWPFAGEEIELASGELVASDNEKILCLVRFRDSKYAPVTTETRNMALHVQSVGEKGSGSVGLALDKTVKLIYETTGGTLTRRELFC